MEIEEAALDISVARNSLPTLGEILQGQRALKITRYNKPFVVILSWDFYKQLTGKADEEENTFERELRERLNQT